MRLFLPAIVLMAVWSGGAAAADNWTKFRSDADGFSIEFPYTPTTQEPLPLVVGGVTIATRSYALDLDKQAYLVSVSALSNRLFVSNPMVFLDSLVKEQTAGAEVETNSPVEIDGNPGRDVVFTTAEGELVYAREIYAAGTLYQIVVRDKAKDHRAAKADAARFLKSFRLGAASQKDAKQTARSPQD